MGSCYRLYWICRCGGLSLSCLHVSCQSAKTWFRSRSILFALVFNFNIILFFFFICARVYVYSCICIPSITFVCVYKVYMPCRVIILESFSLSTASDHIHIIREQQQLQRGILQTKLEYFLPIYSQDTTQQELKTTLWLNVRMRRMYWGLKKSNNQRLKQQARKRS